jgi:sensor histidine kinase YesM
LLITFFVAKAQNPYAYTINNIQGLPNNSVFSMHESKKGLMWFATNQGICSYDGSEFRKYTSTNQTSKAGSNIVEDKYGRIWYINFDGYIYFVNNNKLELLPNQKSIGYVKFGIINNKLFTVQQKQIVIYDIVSLKILKTIPIDTKIFISAIQTKNKYYVLLAEQIIEINPSLSVKKTKINNIKNNITFGTIVTNIKDTLYLFSKESNLYLTYNQGKLNTFSIPQKNIFIQNASVIQDKIWLCTSQGFFQIIDTTRYKKYYQNYNVSGIILDSNKNYWISTLTNGLLFVPDLYSNFIPMNTPPVTLFSYGENVIIGDQKDKILEYKIAENRFDVIDKNENNHEVYYLFYDKQKSNLIYSSFGFKIYNLKSKAKKNIATALKDICKVDDKYYAYAASGTCAIFTDNPLLKSKWDAIYNLYYDKKISSFNEARIISDNKGKSVSYNHSNTTLYFVTNNGLFAQDLNKKFEIKYQNKPLFLSKIKQYNNSIYAFSTNETIYIIDKNHKVSVFNHEIITQNEVVLNMKILNTNLYLFTNNSIYEYNLNTKKHHKILSITQDFSVSDIAITTKNYVFATNKGLLYKSINKNNSNFIPKLTLNSIYVNGLQKSIKDIRNLKYTENELRFHFSVLSFLPGLNFPIHYKINNGNWQKTDDNSRYFNLTSLSPGKYNVVFKTVNSNYSNSNILSVFIEIKAPFWQRLSFIIPLLMLIIGLIYLYFRYKIKKINERNKLVLEKINLEKNLNISTLKAIKSQMNPHFFFNALNTIQSYILSNEKKQAVSYLNKFSSLTRTILEMSEKEYISIAEEIATLKLYLDIEKARFNDDFNYEINIKDHHLENHKIPSLLIQPYVENALKHGLLHKIGQKQLKITFVSTDHYIQIEIDDNGIGRKKSGELNEIRNQKHKSFATKAIEQRIDVLNKNTSKKITISFIDKVTGSGVAIGTKVILNIPYIEIS